MRVYDIVIIGRGISALSAGIYAGMSKTKTVLIRSQSEKHMASGVNRYVGNMEGGYEEFYRKTEKQMERFSVEKMDAEVLGIRVEKKKVVVVTDSGEVESRSVIISTRKALDMLPEDKKKEPFVFLCGTAFNNDTEVASLAGTGAMAAIDARLHLT